jgi:hypothetical protein
VLGQGHFVLAYIYQAESGHLKSHKILMLLGFLIFFSWCAFVLPLPIATVITAVGFLIHFAIDEPRFMGKKHSLFTTLEASPFVLLYSALLSDVILKTHLFYIAVASVVFLMIVYIWLSYVHKRKPDSVTLFYGWWLALTLLAYWIHASSPTYANGLIWFDCLVIVHYLLWYGFYWLKLLNKTFQQTVYIWRVIAVNLVLAVLGIVWISGAAPVLDLFFAPAAYFVWTFVHGVSSMRKDEYKASFQL